MSHYQPINNQCANCGRPPGEHKQFRDAKPPRCVTSPAKCECKGTGTTVGLGGFRLCDACYPHGSRSAAEEQRQAEPKQRMLKPDDRKPAEWALHRGCRLYNHALIDEVHGHMQASDWENAIALAIQDAYEEGVTRGAQTLEERLGA